MSGSSGALRVSVDSKQYSARGETVIALQGLTLTINDGEFVCLVGPSGCGKSTLINIVNGIDRDYRGELSGVDGNVVATMFQTPRLMPWLSVLDNVRLVLDDSEAATATATAALQAVGLGERLDAYPKQLSGGMQRRAALARAFAVNPRLLLMDEPFVSLDLPTANRLRGELIELWQRRRAAVLFVTHDLREALALADRVVFLSPGPGRVVLELPVTLPRPRDVDAPAVTELQQRLLREHPDLLAGLA